MERITKNIKVIISGMNNITRLSTNAMTLGELKTILAEKQIDCNNKIFLEGNSRLSLINDESQLPTNIIERKTGQPTNDLTILITEPKSKIQGGLEDINNLTTKEIHEFIEQNGIDPLIFSEFEVNYRFIRRDQLIKFLIDNKFYTPLKDSHDQTNDCSIKDEIDLLKASILALTSVVECFLREDNIDAEEMRNTIETIKDMLRDEDDCLEKQEDLSEINEIKSMFDFI